MYSMGNAYLIVLVSTGAATIDFFKLYVLYSHFRPCDGTKENCFFQMLFYARASACISMHNL